MQDEHVHRCCQRPLPKCGHRRKCEAYCKKTIFMAQEIRLPITVITNTIFSLINITARENLEELNVPLCPLYFTPCAQEWLRERKGERSKKEQREKGRHSEPASAEGWFCFRNWNVSRLDFYFQFSFQIQLPKLFDLSPCLLTRKRTLGLLSWELGAHVERLARIHILAKFSHTKGPAREKRKDESGGRHDFKGRAAEPGPAQAPPSADIRRGSCARDGLSAQLPRARPRPERAEGTRCGGRGRRGGPPRPEAGPHAKLRRLRKVFRRRGMDFTSSPLGEPSCGLCTFIPARASIPLRTGDSPSRRTAGSSARERRSPRGLTGVPSHLRAPPRGRVAGLFLAHSTPPNPPLVRPLVPVRDHPSWTPLALGGPGVGALASRSAEGRLVPDRRPGCGLGRTLDGRASAPHPASCGRRALPAPARAREKPPGACTRGRPRGAPRADPTRLCAAAAATPSRARRKPGVHGRPNLGTTFSRPQKL